MPTFRPCRQRSFALGEAGLDDFLALSPQVRVQDMGEPAAIAPLQRVQDSFVLLDGKRPMLGDIGVMNRARLIRAAIDS